MTERKGSHHTNKNKKKYENLEREEQLVINNPNNIKSSEDIKKKHETKSLENNKFDNYQNNKTINNSNMQLRSMEKLKDYHLNKHKHLHRSALEAMHMWNTEGMSQKHNQDNEEKEGGHADNNKEMKKNSNNIKNDRR